MPRVWVLVVCTVVLFLSPNLTCAQGLSAISDVLDGAFDSKKQIYVTGAWVANYGDSEYSIVSSVPLAGTVSRDGVWAYDYSAFQFGVGIPVDLDNMGILVASGTIAIPSIGQGEELLTNGFGTTRLARKWSADTYYATLEGLYAYPAVWGWNAVAGFRWIYWQTSYGSPRNVNSLFNPPAAGSDTADVTVNAYLPFVGVVSSMGGLTFGVIGLPTMLGSIEHKENVSSLVLLEGRGKFGRGYFAEIFMDYAIPSFNLGGVEASFSLFSKINWLHGTATLRFERFRRTAAGGTIFRERDYELGFNRSLLTLGGKATINFDTSGLTDLIF